MVRLILSVIILWLMGPVSTSYGSELPKHNLVQNLATGFNFKKFEGNGVAYDSRNNKLWALTTGFLIRMNKDGTDIESWDIGSQDQESIALRYIKGKQQPLIYIGIEYSELTKGAVILEFDVEKNKGEYTGKSWNLNSILPVKDPKNGMESMTFIPDGFHPCNKGIAASGSGGVFAISSQDSQSITFVDLKLRKSNRIREVCGSINTGFVDNSDLFFDAATEKLYALFDKSDKLQIYTVGINPKLDFEIDLEKQLPVFDLNDLNGQEGFTIISDCRKQIADIIISYDENGLNQKILKYSNFPIRCE